MGADAGPSPGDRLLRLLLLLAALDSLAAGGWAVLRPGALFGWLQLRTSPDGLLLVRALGALTLAHVPCLVLAALRPRSWGGLVVVPLLGRALLAGVWLWLLNADRVHPSRPALHGALAHDAVWLPIFVAFLFVSARAPKPA